MTHYNLELSDGDRRGRYVILHDRDGTLHAVSAGAVLAVCETESGALLLLPGARMIQVEQGVHTVLGWLDVGAR